MKHMILLAVPLTAVSLAPVPARAWYHSETSILGDIARHYAMEHYEHHRSESGGYRSSERSSRTVGYNPLPNPRITPGAINGAVTQADIDTTICVRGWTRTVRPPESYTEPLKRRLIRTYGYADHELRDYELDHLEPLELGGAPGSPKNLWPEPHVAQGGWGSRAKDRLENKLHYLVCSGRLSLAAARQMIATNWIAAFKRFIGPRP
ncbi:hypothetical protein [Acidiphilium sp. C61]|uniref:hypothetical protein n=1 Tax=Acidiphilium sp. C61 TaxID=1671485 RepID=UPI00157AB728|nr:hypothetical protein [Acidiphilium sp. C61]